MDFAHDRSSSLEDEPMETVSAAVIKDWVGQFIKDIPESKQAQLVAKLLALGPSCREDLKFLTEDKIAGVLSVLRTARFIHDLKGHFSRGVSCASSSSSNTVRRRDVRFDKTNHKFNFNLIKGELLTACKQEEKLSPSNWRKLAKLLGEYCQSKRPADMHMKAFVDGISEQVAREFKGAVMDMYEGQVLGTGFKTLSTKAYHWIENNQRGSRDKIVPKKSKNAPFLTNAYPLEIDEKACETAKDILKVQFEKPVDTWDLELIRACLTESYALQRKDINSLALTDNTSVVRLVLNEWPFLFHPIGAAIHFTAGTEYNPNRALDQFLATSLSSSYYFFIHHVGAEAAKLHYEMEKTRTILRHLDTRPVYLVCVLEMIAKYFQEDINQLLFMVKDSEIMPPRGSMANINWKIPNTPCLVGKGSSRMACKEFYMFVDSIRVSLAVSAVQGMRVILPTFFMLNIVYHPRVTCTLEFYEKVILKNMSPIINNKITKAISSYDEFKKKLL